MEKYIPQRTNYIGWWFEQYGEGFPSLEYFLNHPNPDQKQAELIEALSSNQTWNTIKISKSPCLFGGRLCNHFHNENHAVRYASNGYMVWQDELLHYIKYHGLTLPADIHDTILLPNPLDYSESFEQMRIVIEITQNKSRDNVKSGQDLPLLTSSLTKHPKLYSEEYHNQLIDRVRERAVSKLAAGDRWGYYSDMNAIQEILTPEQKTELRALLSELAQERHDRLAQESRERKQQREKVRSSQEQPSQESSIEPVPGSMGWLPELPE